jgi:uncharacterized protein (TIGR03083 family)
MATSSPWPLIHTEREALADDLDKLTNAQWAAPSLCTGWTVRDVLGHLTATAKMTPLSFLTGLAGTGFKFNALSEKNIAREATPVPADGLAEFRRHLKDTTHPPGPAEAMLGEAVVHAEDIRRPLGITREYPPAAVTRAASFFSRSNLLIGSKRRIEGVTLRATDADWRHGSGPEVRGPLLSLLLAMTGRAAALADLTGEGVAALRERSSPASG